MDVELAQTLVELEAYRNTVKQLKEELEKLKNKNKALEMYADLADEKIDGLKDDNKVMADNYSKMEQKFYDNLTKAKELLRELYSIVKVECSPFAREEYKNILTEIKEFLKKE